MYGFLALIVVLLAATALEVQAIVDLLEHLIAFVPVVIVAVVIVVIAAAFGRFVADIVRPWAGDQPLRLASDSNPLGTLRLWSVHGFRPGGNRRCLRGRSPSFPPGSRSRLCGRVRRRRHRHGQEMVGEVLEPEGQHFLGIDRQNNRPLSGPSADES